MSQGGSAPSPIGGEGEATILEGSDRPGRPQRLVRCGMAMGVCLFLVSATPMLCFLAALLADDGFGIERLISLKTGVPRCMQKYLIELTLQYEVVHQDFFHIARTFIIIDKRPGM